MVMSRSYPLAFLASVVLAAGSPQPYVGLVGEPKVNPLKDDCWTNVTLSAKGKRALIITTSYGQKLSKGQATGVAVEEFTAPYYVYKDAGMEVSIASIKGGAIPIGEGTATPSQIRYKFDKTLKGLMENSQKLDDVDFADYDIVFMAGGWGAAFDLGQSELLGTKVAAALEARKPFMGSTCHGALGFISANKTDGTPWVKGLTMTGVSMAQIEKLGIMETPLHPELELRKRGANYQCIHGTGLLGDVGATSVAVDVQGPIVVTGQNQNSACVAAQRQVLFMMANSSVEETPFSWVPNDDCKSPLKVCYQGSQADIEHTSKLDPLNFCKYGGHASIKQGTCPSFGYGQRFTTPIGTITKDPIFRKLQIFKASSEEIIV